MTKALRHRHSPSLVTALLTLGAIAFGAMAQTLLRAVPSQSDHALIDALIAQPSGTRLGRFNKKVVDPQKPPLSDSTRKEQLTSATTTDLPEKETSSALNMEIRVALLGVGTWPQLGATSDWQLLDRQGRLLQSGDSSQHLNLTKWKGPELEAWFQASSGGVVQVNGSFYIGKLRLLKASDGVQLVNHLPLETYVSSVVGAEMPSSWNLEALKAQAVAARSYALAHMARPADPHWHLGDSARWQVYRGLATVDKHSLDATTSTAGIILSYQGGIVESLYASTQEISGEAHGHLGASMSQHGAQNLALKGLKYNEILSSYYKGATLARLEAGES